MPDDFSFRLITVTEEIFNDEKIGSLQLVPFKSGVLQLRWVYCDVIKRERRRLLLVEANYRNRFLYFLEAERKRKKRNPEIQTEALATLMVYDSGFSYVDRETLAAVIQCCAEKGYVDLSDQELPDLGREQIRHRLAKVAPDQIANRLRRKMDDVISGS